MIRFVTIHVVGKFEMSFLCFSYCLCGVLMEE
jgi:hypothetical protein